MNTIESKSRNASRRISLLLKTGSFVMLIVTALAMFGIGIFCMLICDVLDCQPGDILEFNRDTEDSV